MVKLLRSVLLMTMIGTSAQANIMPEQPRSAFLRGAGSSAFSNITSHGTRSLATLRAIDSWRDGDLSQPLDSLEALYQLAEQGQQELASLTRQLTATGPAEAQIPPMKSYQRAEAKVAAELGGDASRLTDLARTSVIADDIATLMQAYATLAERADIVQVKNRFLEPAPSGYRDLNVLVRLPQTGLIAEIQFHLTRIAAVKNGPEHQLYEQIQQIERRALAQQRPLSEIEGLRIARLRHASQQLYQQAWRDSLETHRDSAVAMAV